jgi:hypothetical protein
MVCHYGELESPSKPTNQPCSFKQQLIAQVEAAHTRIAEMHNREMEALIRGDFAADAGLMADLKSERSERDEVINQLKLHIAEHGC